MRNFRKASPLLKSISIGILLIAMAMPSVIARAGKAKSSPIATSQSGGESRANNDPLYARLRQLSSGPDAFGGEYGSVTNLVLKRDAATFTLRSGEIYFLKPVDGRALGAVFLGDGHVDMSPPTDVERKSISFFTDNSDLREDFNLLVVRFTDKTFEEVKASPNVKMGTGGTQAGRARDVYREKEAAQRNDIEDNLDVRTLADLYAPPRPGFFYTFIGGRRFSKLVFQLDPMGIPGLMPEQVALYSYGESDYGVWAAFQLAQEYAQQNASDSTDRRVFDITHHAINGAIRGTHLLGTDKITWKPLVAGTRVLPFDLFGSLRVSRVQDESGTDLSFVQEDKDADSDFAVILPQAAELNKTYNLTVQYDGEGAIKDSGGGNFILIPRSTWYPNNLGSDFGDRATFEMTFRYPKGGVFVATGAPDGAETQDGDVKISKWTSGTTELAVAGFNYGKFRKKQMTDKDTGYGIEFYSNSEVPDELKDLEMFLEQLAREKIHMTGITGQLNTGSMSDVAITDTQNSTRVYTGYFGKLPYSRIAISQQPAFGFGQAWPTLVYMPYIAFMEGNQRTQLLGVQGGTDPFWRYVGPHEVAHQWWGHAVGFSSYHDQWMSEGFAEFSTSLYVQYVRKDMAKFNDFWEDQRKLIVESSAATKGKKPYTVGPVTQGYRLNNAKTGNVARYMIYPKGAFILHMIRMMMFDHRGGGDAKFRAMMTDYVQTYLNRDATTENFKAIVEKHMTPQMDLDKNGRMDWYFNQWVYGTDVPAYRFDYKFGSDGGKPTVTARITQSGVADNFRMAVPIYADFGKGWTRLGAAVLKGNSSVDLTNVPMPQQPKALTICALNDVLATSIQVNKQ